MCKNAHFNIQYYFSSWCAASLKQMCVQSPVDNAGDLTSSVSF